MSATDQHTPERPAPGPAPRTLADVFPNCRPEAGDRPGEPTLPALARFNGVGLFCDPEDARAALVELERSGIDERQLSLLALDDPAAARPVSEADAATVAHSGRAVGVGALAAAAFVVAALVGGGLAAGGLSAGVVGIAVGGGLACGVVVGLFTLFARTGAGTQWADSFEIRPDERVVVGVHDDRDPAVVAGALARLRAAGAVRTFDVDRSGRSRLVAG